jgi:pimeloyl-ACP methyl ester carboxylesterase
MHSLVSLDAVSPDAPAIVLVHGSGLSGKYMVPTAQQLAADCRVYVPDLPGFGDSDKPRKVFNVSELADWLEAWIPAIGLDRVSLLGNSFGCQVIADLAARYPDRVERAILFRGPPRRRTNDPSSGNSSAGGKTSATTRLRWGT